MAPAGALCYPLSMAFPRALLAGLVLALAASGLACSDDSSPAADGGADANVDSGPGNPASLLGNWEDAVVAGPTREVLLLTLAGAEDGGTMSLRYTRADGAGAYIGCLRADTTTGSWTAADGVLMTTLTAGRTARVTDPSGMTECAAGNQYEERDMTAEELEAANIVNGPYTLVGDELMTTNLTATYTWMRLE